MSQNQNQKRTPRGSIAVPDTPEDGISDLKIINCWVKIKTKNKFSSRFYSIWKTNLQYKPILQINLPPILLNPAAATSGSKFDEEKQDATE